MLVDEYTPDNLNEVIGNKESIEKINYFIKNFKNIKKNAVLIYGPTGTGKTCTIYAFAKENNYEVLELNASDFRDKKSIEEFMNKAINQYSLFMKPKIILVDEIDGLSGTKDRGGSISLSKLIEQSNFPIILTANDISLDKLTPIIKKSEIIEFKELQNSEIFEKLKEINGKEKFGLSDFILRSIASRSGGDMRGAINDLETLSSTENNEEDIEIIGDRSKEQELTNILRLIFKSKDISLIIKSLEDINLDDLQSWLGENSFLEYNNENVSNAYDSLSKADVFKGRIRKWQYWRFLVYQKFLLSKVALAKTEKSKNIIKYKRPRRGLVIWQANLRNTERKYISEKLAIYLKVSYKKAYRDIYPDIKLILELPEVKKSLELE